MDLRRTHRHVRRCWRHRVRKDEEETRQETTLLLELKPGEKDRRLTISQCGQLSYQVCGQHPWATLSLGVSWQLDRGYQRLHRVHLPRDQSQAPQQAEKIFGKSQHSSHLSAPNFLSRDDEKKIRSPPAETSETPHQLVFHPDSNRDPEAPADKDILVSLPDQIANNQKKKKKKGPKISFHSGTAKIEPRNFTLDYTQTPPETSMIIEKQRQRLLPPP